MRKLHKVQINCSSFGFRSMNSQYNWTHLKCVEFNWNLISYTLKFPQQDLFTNVKMRSPYFVHQQTADIEALDISTKRFISSSIRYIYIVVLYIYSQLREFGYVQTATFASTINIWCVFLECIKHVWLFRGAGDLAGLRIKNVWRF